jgi:uncharacterized FlaG/YvyC family protein
MPSNIGQVGDAVRQAEHAKPLSIQPKRLVIKRLPKGTAGSGIEPVSNQEAQAKAVIEKQPPWQPSPGEAERVMDNLNQILNIFDIEAEILVDPQTNIKVIQLKDNTTQKLIRQVPSEEFLSRMLETRKLIGLLVDQIV